MIKTQNLKYKNIFAKGYTPYWSEEVFVIKKKLQIQFYGHMLLMISMVNKLLEHFVKKICKINKAKRIYDRKSN